VKNPSIIPRFNVQSLVSRRSFVFARAGFGISNLNKLLFSSLYKETPTVEKRGGRKVPRLFNFFWLTEIVLKLGSKTDKNKSNQTYI
jgi:hypothetical protein